jgi:glycosyltransferase involved in cell wall biosynthesis
VKICRVGTVPSTILLIRQQIIEMAEAGLEVTVVCSSFDEYSPTSITFEQLNLPANVRHIEVDIVRNVSLVKDLKALVKLFIVFRKGKFDVVHSIMPKASLLSAVASFFARVPVRLHTFTGQRWVTMTGYKRWAMKAFDWLVAKLNTNVFADSNSQAKFLISEGISRKVDVVGIGSLSGVNLAEFNYEENLSQVDRVREELGFSKEDFVALFVGRLNPDKGVKELFDAFSATAKVTPNFKLLIVGPLEPSLEARYPGLHDQIKAHPKIKVLGYCHPLAPYMAAADFLVLPSYREGFGNVVIEAAALGKPTLGTKIYGLEDAVDDGLTGELIPVKDVRALEQKFINWVSNPDKVVLLGKNALERAKASFASEKITSDLLATYRQLSGNA